MIDYTKTVAFAEENLDLVTKLPKLTFYCELFDF